MASRVAASGTATGGVAVAVVVGEEELLVERAVARLVAAASAAGQGGHAGAAGGTHPAGDGVHEVAGGALSPGELTSLTAPSLFGGGSLVVIRDAHHASKDVTEELAQLAAEPPPDVRLVVTHAGGAKGKPLLASLTGSGARVIECPRSSEWPTGWTSCGGSSAQPGAPSTMAACAP
jgi:DNA polymerase-3 subunit delta